MNAMGGLIIISLPKSGTMFLSQYLQFLTGYQYRFGLLDHMLSPEALAEALLEPDPLIADALDEQEEFASSFLKVYQEKIYPLARTNALEFGDWLIADHAFDDLAVFMRNPTRTILLTPQQVQTCAAKRGMDVLYLYREDIRDVITSMAHFISSGNTRFLKLRSLESAIDVCIERYLPVLAQQVRLWISTFDGMKVSYEMLHRETNATIVSICERFNLPYEHVSVIRQMHEFKASNFRRGGVGNYKQHLRDEQLHHIKSIYPDLCPG